MQQQCIANVVKLTCGKVLKLLELRGRQLLPREVGGRGRGGGRRLGLSGRSPARHHGVALKVQPFMKRGL